MKKRIERLRGMHDLLPETYLHHSWVKERLGMFLEQAGYDHVDSPILEQSDLFHASYGQELWQNLYAFRLHQRELCLRPEYTASLCRLYLDQYQQQPYHCACNTLAPSSATKRLGVVAIASTPSSA